jgi:hypothetical protein
MYEYDRILLHRILVARIFGKILWKPNLKDLSVQHTYMLGMSDKIPKGTVLILIKTDQNVIMVVMIIYWYCEGVWWWIVEHNILTQRGEGSAGMA